MKVYGWVVQTAVIDIDLKDTQYGNGHAKGAVSL